MWEWLQNKMGPFWEPLWDNRSRAWYVLLASFSINTLTLALPLYTRAVYDRVIPYFALESLTALTIGMFIALGFELALRLARHRTIDRQTLRTGAALEGKLFDTLLSLRLDALPYSISRQQYFFREVDLVRDFYCQRFLPVLVDIPFLLLFLLVIFAISPVLALVPLIMAVMMIILSYNWQERGLRWAEKQDQKQKLHDEQVLEFLRNQESFRLHNAAQEPRRKLSKVVADLQKTIFHKNHLNALSMSTQQLLVQVGAVLILCLGVWEVQARALTVGGLIAVNILAGRTMATAMGVAQAISALPMVRAALKSIDDLQKRPTIDDYKDRQIPGDTPLTIGVLVAEDIRCRYGMSSVDSLRIPRLIIAPQQKIGIVGASGSGKTTLLRLLSGVVIPAEGRVLVDGYDLRYIPPSLFNARLGVVPQYPNFIRGTLKDNILFYREMPDAAWLNQILHLTGISAWIGNSGTGVYLPIAEDGQNISGGQRQMIALARALIHNPDLLIMDEFTSDMDQFLEMHVLRNLAPILAAKTLITVSHRLPVLDLTQRILVVERGQIAADGGKDDVLRRLTASAGAA
jgi:ABC-type bacteriocin/lantibiotic exporter with double-glycine peptidase domain